MAKTPNPKDAPADFDDLLATVDPPAAATPADDQDDSGNEDVQDFDALVEVETPAQKRIRELKEELAKPTPRAAEKPVFTKPVEKTDEEIEIEELESQLAIKNAQALENAAEVYDVEAAQAGVLIHVEEDGFNQWGRVWNRGQEIRIDQKAYERTVDREGNSWVDSLLADAHAQFAAWGKVYVAPGPFVPRPGEVFNDALVKEDARRRGAVPVVER